jgi:hypothetical protein
MPIGGIGSAALIAAAGKGTEGLISGITSFFQNKKAKKLEDENIRPTEQIPQGVRDNQEIAKFLAQTGMSGPEYLQQQKNIQESASVATTAATDRRSGVATIGAIQAGTNNATLNLNSASDQIRRQNIGVLMGANETMAQWQDKIWQWNSRAKYEENAAAIRALKGAAGANLNTALNSLGSAGANLATTPHTSSPAMGNNSVPASVNQVNSDQPQIAQRDWNGPQEQTAPVPQINATAPDAPQSIDPTTTYPGLYPNGQPTAWLDYLTKLKNVA